MIARRTRRSLQPGLHTLLPADRPGAVSRRRLDGEVAEAPSGRADASPTAAAGCAGGPRQRGGTPDGPRALRPLSVSRGRRRRARHARSHPGRTGATNPFECRAIKAPSAPVAAIRHARRCSRPARCGDCRQHAGFVVLPQSRRFHATNRPASPSRSRVGPMGLPPRLRPSPRCAMAMPSSSRAEGRSSFRRYDGTGKR